MIRLDDRRREIRLETPGRQTLTHDDEARSIELSDMHSNRIGLSPDGIEVISSKRLVFRAPQDIAFEGLQGMTFQSSGGNIALAGLNVSVQAQGAATVCANTMARLSGAAITVVEGGQVQISR